VTRLLVLALLVGCGGNSTAPVVRRGPGPTVDDARRDGPAGFPIQAPFARPGEVMSYRLSMLDLEVAAYTFAVGQPTQLAGHDVVVVQSGVQTTGIAGLLRTVSDNFTSWIDAATTQPVLFRADELASKHDATIERTDAEVSALVDGAFPVRVTRPDLGEVVESQVTSDAPLYDLNGFLLVLRSWEAEPGTTVTADVIRSRYIWRTDVTMVGYESVRTELGEVGTLKIEGSSRRVRRDGTIDPTSDTRTYALWISDDADRVPVLMIAHTDYGDLRMELVAYASGS